MNKSWYLKKSWLQEFGVLEEVLVAGVWCTWRSLGCRSLVYLKKSWLQEFGVLEEVLVAGALLVRCGSERVLEKTYFGGGTVQVALAQELFHVNRKDISER